MNKKYRMQETGVNGRYQQYAIQAVETGRAQNSLLTDYGADSNAVFSNDAFGLTNKRTINVKGKKYEYVLWGADDQLPYTLYDALSSNMITAQCQSFNITCCYGRGVRFVDRSTKKDIDDEEILDFCLRNSLHEVFLEQVTDMKFWSWTVTVIVLSRDGTKIVQVRNRDVMNCRLEYADSTKSGNVEHVLYGDWRTAHFKEADIEAIPLLNYYDPLGDLRVRLGKEPDPVTGEIRKPTTNRKFAIITRMSTPGNGYYQMPYYLSSMRDYWLDIYRLIGLGKREMIKNTSAPRLQIEVHEEYWDNVCNNENILDPQKRIERIKQEKRNIIEFVTGVQNAGKALISGYYIDPNGRENRMVRINNIYDTGKKEGGNWSDDMSEASNAICFAFGVHPNLVGATPGKSQMNNSGSDKRELFTLKQSLEIPSHDVMCKPYHVILHYNGWSQKATVDVPMIMLTTLDKNKDAVEVSSQNNDKNNTGGNE